MKILILLLVLLFSCSLVYADYATLSGVSWTPVTKTYSTAGTASGAIVWTPASGAKINLLGVYLYGQKAGNLTTMSLKTGTVYLTGGTDIIPATLIASGPTVINSSVPIWRGSTDANLSITTSTAPVLVPSVVLWGYESN